MEKNTYVPDYLGAGIVNPLLTDFYQFTMVYAHWKNGRSHEHSVFELFFRKKPFDFDVIFCIK
jgi:nicotinate phosphoribosyltransferase